MIGNRTALLLAPGGDNVTEVGRPVDRMGPRAIVITAQLLQAGGSVAYLVAPRFGNGGAAVAAPLLQAAGQRSFYGAVFSLVAYMGGDGPPDRPFTLVAMVRSAAFVMAAVVLTLGVDGGSGSSRPPRT